MIPLGVLAGRRASGEVTIRSVQEGLTVDIPAGAPGALLVVTGGGDTPVTDVTLAGDDASLLDLRTSGSAETSRQVSMWWGPEPTPDTGVEITTSTIVRQHVATIMLDGVRLDTPMRDSQSFSSTGSGAPPDLTPPVSNGGLVIFGFCARSGVLFGPAYEYQETLVSQNDNNSVGRSTLITASAHGPVSYSPSSAAIRAGLALSLSPA